jgi:outer membrane receptor protein involved in Fe transport
MRLFGGRMTLNSDVFISNYAGYQIVGEAPPPGPPGEDITRNAGVARMKGIESDVVVLPGDQWRLSLSGDYINARFVAITAIDAAYEVGDPVDFVPRYQVTASMERGFRWGERSGFGRLDYTDRSRTTFRDRAIGDWYYSVSDPLHLLNFRMGVEWTNNMELGFFAENLLNDRGFTGPGRVETYAPRERPRTFGVDFTVKVD